MTTLCSCDILCLKVLICHCNFRRVFCGNSERQFMTCSVPCPLPVPFGCHRINTFRSQCLLMRHRVRSLSPESCFKKRPPKYGLIRCPRKIARSFYVPFEHAHDVGAQETQGLVLGLACVMVFQIRPQNSSALHNITWRKRKRNSMLQKEYPQSAIAQRNPTPYEHEAHPVASPRVLRAIPTYQLLAALSIQTWLNGYKSSRDEQLFSVLNFSSGNCTSDVQYSRSGSQVVKALNNAKNNLVEVVRSVLGNIPIDLGPP